MIPLGLLSQIYFTCAGLGLAFFVFTFATGQLDNDGDDGGAGGDGDGDADGDGDFDADSGSTGSTSHSGARVGSAASIAHGFSAVLLWLPSPMALACFLSFFGLTGIACLSGLPWLGAFSILPALAVAWLVRQLLKNVVHYMMNNMQSSNHIKSTDIIGQIASVNVPIHAGRTGEVVYTVRSRKVSSAALSFTEGAEIGKGERVLIVESKGHTVIVQPYDAELLELKS